MFTIGGFHCKSWKRLVFGFFIWLLCKWKCYQLKTKNSSLLLLFWLNAPVVTAKVNEVWHNTLLRIENTFNFLQKIIVKNERREMKGDSSRVSKLVETSGKGLSTIGSSSRKLTGKALVSGVQAKAASDSKTTPLTLTPGTSLVVASVMRTDCSTVNIEQSMSPASVTQHLPESSKLAGEAGMCFIVIIIGVMTLGS